MKKSTLYLLGLVGGLGVASSDVYVSSLPQLSYILGLTSHALRMTFSGYFIAMALSSLSYGIVCRFIPRNYLFLGAFILFFSASISLALATQAPYICAARLCQGIAFGFIQPLIIAAIKQGARVNMSQSMAAYSFASELLSIVLPLLGALSFTCLSWRTPFLMIALLTLCLWGVTRKIIVDEKLEISIGYQKTNYKMILKNKNFFYYNILSFLMIGLGWGVITISSYLYNDSIFHGVFYALYGIMYAAGCLACERQLLTMQTILRVSPFLLIGIAANIVYGVVYNNLYILTPAILVFGSLSGLAYGPFIDQSLVTVASHEVNAASSLIVFIRLLGSFIFIVASSYLYDISVESYVMLLTISFIGLMGVSLLTQVDSYNRNTSRV